MNKIYQNMQKNSLIFPVFFFFLWFSVKAFADDQPMKSTKLYIAKVFIGQGVDTTYFRESKVHAAMNYITMLCNKYELVSDSAIINATKELKENYSAVDIAKKVKADKVLLIRVEQMKNILRTEISQIEMQNPDKVIRGDGFAFMHYFSKNTEKVLYDPSIIESLQRAFAVVENDSSMFVNQNGVYAVKPIPLLVIGGIEIKHDSSDVYLEMLENKTLRSYEIAETIFEAASKSKDYLTFDIDSRDAIYTTYKIYGIENNIAISKAELSALRHFGISYYIAGDLKQIGASLQINLSLNQIKKNTVEKINELSKTITEDDKKMMLETIKDLTQKLLKM